MDYTTMKVPKELHRQLKIAAILEGTTLQAFAETALRRALDGNGKRLVDTRANYETEAPK